MGCDWAGLIKQIKDLDVAGKRKSRLVNSVIILSENLGKDWPVTDGHTLLFQLQNIYGSPFDELIPILACNIRKMKAVADIGEIVRRIRHPREYFGAAAELEVGSLLVKNGCQLTIGPEVGDKKPDFLCAKNGLEFLVEVKMLETSEASKESFQTMLRILKACSPIYPVGIIRRSLRGTELAAVERKLKTRASHVIVGSPCEIDISNILKLYLVHPDDPKRIRCYDTWNHKQEEPMIQKNSGLLGPPVDWTDIERIRLKIDCVAREEQLPNHMAGVLFIIGRFSFWDRDVDKIVGTIAQDLRKFTHISAIVLIGAKTATESPVESRIHEDGRHIYIIYSLAPFLMEHVLIIKNNVCRFSFDCSVLKQMFVESNRKF